MKEGKELVVLFLAIVFIGFGALLGDIYNRGYEEGQINYSLGKIKYAVMDGVKVHFYDFVDAKIKEE